MKKKARLILQNGMEFFGQRFGYDDDAVGEIVFTTAMTGHIETVTDPSYYGQMVVQTFPLIGNCGIIREDFESESPALKAYIVREWCQNPSNFRNEGVFDAFLMSAGVVGLYGLDTRRLTRVLRRYGVMNACVTSSGEDASIIAARLSNSHASSGVSVVGRRELLPAKDGTGQHVVLWDFGEKNSVVKNLERRGFRVTRAPQDYTAQQIAALNPDGVVLSEGPGDPREYTVLIEHIRTLCGMSIPLFGIGLGHQLMALALGGGIEKLPYGHRGGSQPVRDCDTGRVYMTAQNHGYAVSVNKLPGGAKARFTNANDGTVEGLVYHGKKMLSVQFTPGSSDGTTDTAFLLDMFADFMK